MTEVLHRLTSADLTALATALRAGRLDAPFTPVAVRRFYGGGHAAELSLCFASLSGDGVSARHIAVILDAITASRGHRPSVDESVELVWTGPEAAGIANRDTGVVVRELFGEAQFDILVAGFAVYQGKEVFRRLAERMAQVPCLRVRLFLDIRRDRGDRSPASELTQRFLTRFRGHEWPGEKLPELYFDPRSLDDPTEKRSSLHAKCVVIDRRFALVTSANFTEAAHTRNIEVGALVRSAAFAASLADHFDALVGAKLLSPLCHG